MTDSLACQFEPELGPKLKLKRGKSCELMRRRDWPAHLQCSWLSFNFVAFYSHRLARNRGSLWTEMIAAPVFLVISSFGSK